MKWLARNTLSKEVAEIETTNQPVVEFEEIAVWLPTQVDDAWIAGPYKWKHLLPTADSIEILKDLISRANGAVYFELEELDTKEHRTFVDAAVLLADEKSLYIRNAEMRSNATTI